MYAMLDAHSRSSKIQLKGIKFSAVLLLINFAKNVVLYFANIFVSHLML